MEALSEQRPKHGKQFEVGSWVVGLGDNIEPVIVGAIKFTEIG